jgi:hypothetical protein
MKTNTSQARTLLLAAGLVAVVFLGAGCTQSINVPINLVDGFSIPNLGGLVAGVDIPEDLEIPELPVCGSMPTRADIDALIKKTLGSVIGNLVKLESVTLANTTLTATDGSFKDLTYFGIYWQPSPIEGVDQAKIDLGYGASTLGLLSPLVLTPTSEVDFLTLIDNESGNSNNECPSLGVRVLGSVPTTEDMPTISMKINLKITVSFGL